ncbi:hypothetical protein [Rhodanobacter sp. BL-MT-08]
MTVSREQIQRELDAFELEMRIVAATYVTTERFLKDFLRPADKLSRRAPAEDHEWVCAQISHILLKFGFKVDDGDTLS